MHLFNLPLIGAFMLLLNFAFGAVFTPNDEDAENSKLKRNIIQMNDKFNRDGAINSLGLQGELLHSKVASFLNSNLDKEPAEVSRNSVSYNSLSNDKSNDTKVEQDIKEKGENELKEQEVEEEEEIGEKKGAFDEETSKIPIPTREEVPEQCKRETYNIISPSDLDAIMHCRIVYGNIFINNYKQSYLNFGEIESIDGSLSVTKSPEVIRIEAPRLRTISNTFTLKELTSIIVVSLPELKSVRVIDWQVLPILGTVYLSSNVEDVQSITISDTSLTGFSGFMSKELDILDINNNRYLDSISSDVETVNSRLHFAANAADVRVDLPKLKAANNMSIHEVAAINLNELENVDNSVSLIHNFFTQLKVPKLKRVGGTLSLLKNERLNQAEFPNITEIGGGLMIVNNTNIEKVNFLPKLSTIGGAIEFVGNIKETSLKSLRLVKGSAIVKSSAVEFDCNKWSKSEVGTVIRGGRIECTNANNEKIVSRTPTDDIKENNSNEDENSSQSRFDVKVKSSAPSLGLSLTKNVLFIIITIFFQLC